MPKYLEMKKINRKFRGWKIVIKPHGASRTFKHWPNGVAIFLKVTINLIFHSKNMCLRFMLILR